MARRWTEDEKTTLSYLLSFPGKYSYLDLADALNRPVSGIKRICAELNLQDNIKKSKSNGEDLLFNFLKEIYPNLIVKKQYSVGDRLSLDLYIPDLFIGFEYDGIQHSQETSFFHKNKDSFIRGQVLDSKKDDICASKGIHLIRIGYEDILSKEFILNEINKVGPGSGNSLDCSDSFDALKKKANKKKYQSMKEMKQNSEYHKSLKEQSKKRSRERYLYLKELKKKYGN